MNIFLWIVGIAVVLFLLGVLFCWLAWWGDKFTKQGK